ncbi:hypothetical protein PQQ84_05760 [Paraburkholderia strydomiana]|uniref:hypothetical protein n=1 Tax=Paraburkholderia strydomiana TaxID=1245417 RepID=UPI0038BBF9EA
MTATTSKLGADMTDELIELLREIRPNYGDVRSRDVDVSKRQEQIDRAIALLTRQPAAIDKQEAEAKAADFMVAARNAQMFQDVRELVSTFTDPKANCPGRHLEAQRVLPLLDAFLGEGYTGRVLSFKRALERAESEGPEFEDGPDESGFKGPRPWNGFRADVDTRTHGDLLAGDIWPNTGTSKAAPSQSAKVTEDVSLVRELQKALFYWMPGIAGEDSPAGQKAAEHAYLLVGLDDNSTECWGDQILNYIGTLHREQERLGLILSDAGCTDEDDYLEFVESLAARAASTSANVAQGAAIDQRFDALRATGHGFYGALRNIVNSDKAAPTEILAICGMAQDAEPIYQEQSPNGLWSDVSKDLYDCLVEGRLRGGTPRIVYTALTAAQSSSGDTK